MGHVGIFGAFPITMQLLASRLLFFRQISRFFLTWLNAPFRPMCTIVASRFPCSDLQNDKIRNIWWMIICPLVEVMYQSKIPWMSRILISRLWDVSTSDCAFKITVANYIIFFLFVYVFVPPNETIIVVHCCLENYFKCLWHFFYFTWNCKTAVQRQIHLVVRLKVD